jgi:hypothetical protein
VASLLNRRIGQAAECGELPSVAEQLAGRLEVVQGVICNRTAEIVDDVVEYSRVILLDRSSDVIQCCHSHPFLPRRTVQRS